MTLYLNFRTAGIGGGITDAYMLEGDGTANPPALSAVQWPDVARRVAGKDVLIGVHGFNVNYQRGAQAFGLLDAYLNLAASEVLVGVLWPGDFWIPVVNYPFEGSDAMDCGKRLALFCDKYFAGAQSVSFVSHSLGARLVLETMSHLGRRARMICLMAGAINNDCLTQEYHGAASNADRIYVLASHGDSVVHVAFQIGDPISNVLDHDHAFFTKALGYEGPPLPAAPPVLFPWQIQDNFSYGHGDYLPPTTNPLMASRVGDYILRAFRGQAQPRPGAL